MKANNFIVALLIVIGMVLLLGFVGLEDAQALDETVTFWTNIKTNMDKPWFIVSAIAAVGVPSLCLVLSNGKKALGYRK